MPTPSYAAPQTASPGSRTSSRGPRRPGRGARRRTAAEHRPTAGRARRPERAQADRLGEVGQGERRRAPRRCAAASAPRGAGRPSSAAPAASSAPASRTQSHFAKENVAALIACPSTGGTRKPEPVTSGNPRAGNASVTIAIEAYSIRASSGPRSGATSLSSRAVARAGVASTTASAWTTSGRGWSRPRGSSRRRAAGQVADRRAGAHRAPRTPRSSAPASRPTPPRSPAKTGASAASAGGSAAAAARVSDRSRSSSATSCGTAARAEISRACPAYTPPSSGSTSRSTTSLPSRSSTR